MKIKDLDIVIGYYLFGIIIFMLRISIRKYWFLSIVPLTIYLLIKSSSKIKKNLESLLIYIYSTVTFCINFITGNFSVIPFFIITNYIFAKSKKINIRRIYNLSKYIAYIGILMYSIKAFSTGNFINPNPFSNSKNMIILPFMPFIVLYHFNDKRIIDKLAYLILLGMFIFTFSIGNFLLSIILFLALFAPNSSFIDSCKRIDFNKFLIKKSSLRVVVIFLISSLIVIFTLNYIFNIFASNSFSAEFNSSFQRIYLLFDGESYDFFDYAKFLPRVDLFSQYISSLSIKKILIGDPDFIFYTLLNDTMTNPHNSLLLSQMNMGIVGLIFYIHLLIKTIYIFIRQNIKLSLIAFGILLRSLSDIILVLSGHASFLIFLILFNPTIFLLDRNFSKGSKENKIVQNI